MSNEREGRNEHEIPERWSARQKTEAVLRLLRGEDLGEVSRELQVEAHVLEEVKAVRREMEGTRKNPAKETPLREADRRQRRSRHPLRE